MHQIRKQKVRLLYPELSYKIGGILFNVFSELGPGYIEKHIQRAVAIALRKTGLKFKEQVKVSMEFQGKIIGRYFMDFVVEDKIVVELKRGERFYKKDYEQVKQYLIKSGLKLGLLARFGENGVIMNRVLNPNNFS